MLAAAWVGAIGSIFAVIYAIVYWVRRPRLDISFQPDRDCMMLGWGGKEIDTIPVCYLRLFVENTGKRKAKNAQIRVTRVETKQPNGNYAKRDEFPSMNLIWSTQKVLQSIQATSDEYCNLAHIFKPSDRCSDQMAKSNPLEDRIWTGIDRNQTILSVDVDKLHSKPHLLPAGTHRFHIKLTADDAKPQTKMIEVNLSGEWFDDAKEMCSQGVTVVLTETASSV